MNKKMMVVFVNIYVVFVLAGWTAIQSANAAIVSHEGTATVKEIDLGKGIVKLAHGPIVFLKWPAMTMDFKVRDRLLMQGIEVNDMVSFTFIESNGNYVVTHIRLNK